MNRDDIEKLLGGYAAGTLTAIERQSLFAAALEDQQLFDSLAAEEPLRQLLQEPAARAQLLAALDQRPAPWYRRFVRPALGVAAAAAMLLMAIFVRYEPPKPEPVIVAETRHEPVRSFQPPIPVERSPLPRVLQSTPKAFPPPPELPAPVPAAPSLDAIAPAPPSAPSAQNTAEALSATNVEPESAKTAASPKARKPAFQALNAIARTGDDAGVSRLGLRYTVYRKSPAGELTEVDPRIALNRSDEVVIRFESSQAGFLTVSQFDSPNVLRTIASQRLAPSVPYTVPASGSLQSNGAGMREFFVLFSRLPENVKKFAGDSPVAPEPAASVLSTAAKPSNQQATFTITLKYK